jgi:hypothetical protein
MTETEMYCDICKRKIDDNGVRICASRVILQTLSKNNKVIDEFYDDICLDCAIKIQKYIDSIKVK